MASSPAQTLLAPPTPASQPRPRTLRQLGLPRLSVVIVNYRQWEPTAELVRQLLASACVRRGDAEIVIIDNHSPAHPLAKKLRRLPQVSLRRWGKNHGFARAVNEGCRLSQGDWFLLLNPDTTLSEGFLDSALAVADQLAAADDRAGSDRAGIVGFHLRDSDGGQQLSSGPFPTLLSTLARLAVPRRRRKYRPVRGADRQPVAWVTGCCLLVRRACLHDLGGLDERFFLYYEDVDLCLRARAHGWSVWYEPNLAVVHHHPLHSRPVPAALRLVTRHSLLTFGAKHWPRWQFRLLARIVAAETWTRRAWAWWRGDVQQANSFRELNAVVASLLHDDEAAARRRLEQAIQRLDLRVGV
ncbi:MAG: glycosyltransferase family 2 protein [Gemmataceae bacterium]|nr:glycosyltransferase family 2 protein [Gemmataceae bacterium]